jgi:transposase-like protein
MPIIVEDYCPRCNHNNAFEEISADWDMVEYRCIDCGFIRQEYCPDDFFYDNEDPRVD